MHLNYQERDMELSLDLSLAFVPKTISELLGEVSRSTDGSERLSKLDDFLKKLEDEMRKIEAFKRELPLSMLLVNDAIVRLKEQRVQLLQMEDEPGTEEFIPLKKGGGEEGAANKDNNSNDKKSWMSSVQLWSTDTRSRKEEDYQSIPQTPIQSLDKNNRGGAFISLNRGNSDISLTKNLIKSNREVSQVPSFSLMTPISDLSSSHTQGNSKGGTKTSLQAEPIKIHGQPRGQQLQQTSRKQRRCWSAELHKRFVNALQQLGGAQVATPKQIRELMRVEGLTNDEVKSHLQKYRLHVRRFPSSPASPPNGLWMTQDQCGETSKTNLSQSDSPQGPLLLGGSVRVFSSTGGNSLDAEDDENSEGYSWKGSFHQQGEFDVQS